MNEIVERGAIRLFWKAEHLDPSSDAGGVSESEWFGETFPETLSERKRQFWRYLMTEAIAAMREPTEEMEFTGLAASVPGHVFSGVRLHPDPKDQSVMYVPSRMALRDAWRAMIDAALADHPAAPGDAPRD